MIFRSAQPEDKAAVIDLLASAFDGWHGDKNDAFWDWKFQRNPHGSAHISVAEDDGRLAGCYVLNPVRVHVGETTALAAQSVDAAVSPDYRGQGVFTDLAKTGLQEADETGIQLVYAFPTPGAFGGQIRMGFKPHLVIPKAYRPLIGSPRARHADGLEFGSVDRFDDRFAAFALRGRDGELIVQRDPAYLQWRYFEHPTQTYETLTCERDGELLGYCVLTVNPDARVPVGYVVDLQVRPDAGSAAKPLVTRALRRMRAHHARLAVSWERPDGPEHQALSSHGFSSRYVSIRRLLTRPDFVDQLIVFEGGRNRVAHSDTFRWSLVPGDADYV